jgi:hypothetical protein
MKSVHNSEVTMTTQLTAVMIIAASLAAVLGSARIKY